MVDTFLTVIATHAVPVETRLPAPGGPLGAVGAVDGVVAVAPEEPQRVRCHREGPEELTELTLRRGAWARSRVGGHGYGGPGHWTTLQKPLLDGPSRCGSDCFEALESMCWPLVPLDLIIGHWSEQGGRGKQRGK